jgi:hypothetical protein
MRGKSNLTILFVLIISVLALCVFAQVQPDKQQEEMRKALLLKNSQSQHHLERLQEDKQKAVRKMMLIDKQVITLLQAINQHDCFFDAIFRENGKVAYITIPPTSFDSPASFRNAILRIETMDGSVQKIPLFQVKEVTIEHGENIR